METTTKTTSCSDEELDQQIGALLGRLNRADKLRLLGGQPTCGATFECEKIGLPPLRMSDGPMGVHWWCSRAVAYPALICGAAAWDTRIWRSLGQALGRDCRARGVHILLAPGVNLYRSPLCGRNFEYCGEDPHLASRVAVEFIRGVQEYGVSCTVKHLAANFQEYDRHNVSSDMDERTLNEVYLRAFRAAVTEANCGAVMTAYNLLNGVHCSEHDHLIRDILKGKWQFDGLVMSDWTSTYDPVAAANAGLDLEMPHADRMTAANLEPAIESGQVREDVIDDKIRRMLRLALRFDWLTPRTESDPMDVVDSRNRQVALEVARAGVVLLKNECRVLPLDPCCLRKVVVLGPNAHPAIFSGGGSALTNPTGTTSVLDGIQALVRGQADVIFSDCIGREPSRLAFEFSGFESELGAGLRGEYFDNSSLEGEPRRVVLDSTIDFKWGPSTPLSESKSVAFSVRWTGTLHVEQSGTYGVHCKTFNNACRVWINGQQILDSWNDAQHGVAKTLIELTPGKSYPIRIEWSKRQYWSGMQLGLEIENRAFPTLDESVALARDADAAIVCVGFSEETEGEGFDRPFAMDPRHEELILAVAAAQPKTIVVVNAGGAVDTRRWLDAVPALIYGFYPGQEGGQAIAEVLFGACNPSGRLPFTFEREPEDRSSFACYHADPASKRVELADKLDVGYRHFDKRGIEPLFPFGFGLSYTEFSIENLKLSRSEMTATGRIEAQVEVTNNGVHAGSEVVQLYVGNPGARLPRPTKELKAFDKVALAPGERKTITFVIDQRALESFDPEVGDFVVAPGRFVVFVGKNAGSTPLQAGFSVVA